MSDTGDDREIDFRYAPEVVQTCIGLVDDPHKTVVREDGSLNYGYEPGLPEGEAQVGYADDISPYATPRHDTFRFTHRLTPTFTHRDELLDRYQEYGDPGRAFVTTVEEYEETTFRWRTFAYRDDDVRADVVRWWLEADEGFGHAPTRVELTLDGSAEDLPTVIETPGTTAYWTPDGLRLPGLDHYAFLEGGETRTGAFAVVLDGDLAPETVTTEWAATAEERMADYWDDTHPFQNRFEVPDDDVMDMLTACGRNILQAREKVGADSDYKIDVREYQVGPTEYRGLWIVDGHFILEAVHMLGRAEEAFEQGILALLRRVKPSGAIQDIEGHDKETGIALATFVRQCALVDDDDRLRELWPTMCRAREYLEDLRAEAEAMGPDYPGQSLFPPAFLDGGVGGPYPDYTTPLWILVGLREAAEAGDRLDLPEHEAFRTLYEEVFEGFRTCAERDRRETEDGIPYLPMVMEDVEYNRPQSATWALAHAIYPGELFDPSDDLVQDFLDLLDSVDDEEGIPKNTGWIHDQGVWSYSAMFYAQVWLYAGHPEKAVDYLYAFANHAAPSRVWREEQALRDSHSAEFCGDMPHNWASAEFVRLVRHLIVLERDGDLELLAGLPDEWLPTADRPLVVTETPTRYGTVDLRLEADDGGYRLSVDCREGNRTPDDVVVHWPGSVESTDASATAVSIRGTDRWVVPGDAASFTLHLAE